MLIAKVIYAFFIFTQNLVLFRSTDELANSRGKTSGFHKNAPKLRGIKNLLELKISEKIDKPSLNVTTGMNNVSAVWGNDKTIARSSKIRPKLINLTPLLSKRYYKYF